MVIYKINSERLRKLMKDKNIKAYKLADELTNMGYSMSTNTIRNYLIENTSPKNLEYVKAIADYFSVSTDYLLGFSNAKTINIDIKNICNEYGLNETSLSALKILNNEKKAFKKKNIDTVNYLLEDFSNNGKNSILSAITDYLFFTNIFPKGIEIPISTNKSGVTTILTVDNDTAVKSILIKEIEDKLTWLKDEIKKEGEK